MHQIFTNDHDNAIYVTVTLVFYIHFIAVNVTEPLL